MNRDARHRYGLALLLCAAAALGSRLQPTRYVDPPADSLATLIPRSFGEWHEIDRGPAAVDPNRERAGTEQTIDSPYDEVLLRSYANADGAIVQLALAYGRRQRQEVKIHRPVLCYTAQGFQIRHVDHAQFTGMGTPDRPINGARMLAVAPGRIEAVSYWIRVGGLYSDNAWAIRYQILKEGIKGKVDDGVLVRASQIVSGTESDLAASYLLQDRFLSALVATLPESTRRLLLV
jgi:EpsI family protein